jgi:hypothetical protein
MPRQKEISTKIKVTILPYQKSSISYSIRTNPDLTKEELTKKIIKFLKEQL